MGLMDDFAHFVLHGDFTETERDGRFLGPMGLSGEAGEVLELLRDRGVGESELAIATSRVSERFKKHLLHYKDLDREALILEMGDVLWYFTHILNANNITFYQVIQANVVKLCDRYPEKNGDPDSWLF